MTANQSAVDRARRKQYIWAKRRDDAEKGLSNSAEADRHIWEQLRDEALQNLAAAEAEEQEAQP